MALQKQKFREMLFQMLYSIDYSLPEREDLLELIMVKLKVARSEVKSALDKLDLMRQEMSRLDALIGEESKNYPTDKITRIEKNILRLALYEIFYEELPKEVAISEAIRLCKKFSSHESAKFINAVLDAASRKEQASV